jgi:hypothetical protein
MRLEPDDCTAIGEIVAGRYFKKSGWKYTNLRDIRKIFRAYNELEDQYNTYPYMSRDWYVSNSVDKDIYIVKTWKELKRLVDFLNEYGDRQVFSFIVASDNRIALCKVVTNESKADKEAADIAREHGYMLHLFKVKVPNNVEYDIDTIV